ncbi:ubiquitin-like domain-containing protein [Jeotgalibacillus haloalkalitolerans]|uniref:Ubiquitin-like domain-containing protein n=1 Tax=Jeotgalibacillus haloalkalitolerans TaxID=3104292 RepID=A0ABU5KRB3_9BACL|nr:ubiquitin-like domain-containing protein [Jeotgalibacillus sp. HH7-29]MDZ5713779.1 ubiquitin-like domain-containing protein [Jeotgalibacillus sp. HH7-29]
MQSEKNMKNLFPKSMSKRNWVYSLVTLTVFVLVVGFLFQEGMKKTVALSLNGEEQLVRTNAATVEDIFAELEMDLHSEDYLYPSGDTEVYHDMTVNWRAAKQVSFDLGGETQTIMTNAQTVGEFLRKEQLEVSDVDKLSHALNESIEEDMTLSLEKAFAWTLVNGTDKEEVWSTSITVADFLKQHEIKLDQDDRVEPSEDTMLTEGATVKIVHVDKVTDVVEETKDFSVEEKDDNTLAEGTEKVVQEGEEGLIEKTYEVVKENGKEVSRDLKEEKTVKESKNKVVAIGTKKPVVASVPRETTKKAVASNSASEPEASESEASTAEASSQPAQTSSSSEPSGRELTMSSTAYTASCAGCSGITATGINLKANPGMKVIAVDPSVIPLGSRVYVEGYGYAIAGDTGGAIKGNKIDIFIADRASALAWGNRTVKVTVMP